MVVDTGTAILILGAFVLPGFITLILRERLYVVQGHETPFERLLSALLYSAVIYGVLLVVAHGLGLQKDDLVEFQDGRKPLGDDLLAAFAIFLLLPGLVAVIGTRWVGSRKLRPSVLRLVGSSETHSSVSAWNWLFSEREPCLIRVTLTDGRIVAGLYDDRGLSGYSEQVPDLYLSQRWELDDERWFMGPARRSLGIWVPAQSIASLEIYALEDIGSLERETPKIRS